jgi:hypothetical protein
MGDSEPTNKEMNSFGRSESRMTKLPIAIGLMVCEQMIVEEKTHNITLVNCFNHLRVRKVPSEPQRLAFFALLTDGLGAGKIQVVVARPDTLEEILRKEIQATFVDPLRQVRVFFRDALSYPVAGRYQITLLADEQVITQRVFQVYVMEETS